MVHTIQLLTKMSNICVCVQDTIVMFIQMGHIWLNILEFLVDIIRLWNVCWWWWWTFLWLFSLICPFLTHTMETLCPIIIWLNQNRIKFSFFFIFQYVFFLSAIRAIFGSLHAAIWFGMFRTSSFNVRQSLRFSLIASTRRIKQIVNKRMNGGESERENDFWQTSQMH